MNFKVKNSPEGSKTIENFLIAGIFIVFSVFLLIALNGCAASYGTNHNGTNGKNGTNGTNGQDGAAGEQGQAGQPCTVTQTDQGTLVTCPDGSTALIPPQHDPTYLCHVPPGNPAHSSNLYVPQAAVAAHLGHGDYTGECL